MAAKFKVVHAINTFGSNSADNLANTSPSPWLATGRSVALLEFLAGEIKLASISIKNNGSAFIRILGGSSADLAELKQSIDRGEELTSDLVEAKLKVIVPQTQLVTAEQSRISAHPRMNRAHTFRKFSKYVVTEQSRWAGLLIEISPIVDGIPSVGLSWVQAFGAASASSPVSGSPSQASQASQASQSSQQAAAEPPAKRVWTPKNVISEREFRMQVLAAERAVAKSRPTSTATKGLAEDSGHAAPELAPILSDAEVWARAGKTPQSDSLTSSSFTNSPFLSSHASSSASSSARSAPSAAAAAAQPRSSRYLCPKHPTVACLYRKVHASKGPKGAAPDASGRVGVFVCAYEGDGDAMDDTDGPCQFRVFESEVS